MWASSFYMFIESLPHLKNQKKKMSKSWNNDVIDEWMGRRMDGQAMDRAEFNESSDRVGILKRETKQPLIVGNNLGQLINIS